MEIGRNVGEDIYAGMPRLSDVRATSMTVSRGEKVSALTILLWKGLRRCDIAESRAGFKYSFQFPCYSSPFSTRCLVSS